ncbi:MAG: alanine racemase [Zoogloeaceae bacterium]|nr:alanine racemase [Zoogloeaceae bacterium]
MPRPIRATVDLGAFRHNYQLSQRLAGPDRRALAVVKANAYGHGLLPCAEAIRDIAHGFALLDMAEAVQLRESGFDQSIVLLEGCFDREDLREARRFRLTPVVHHPQQLADLADPAWDCGPVDVLVKVNTGMNRLGFLPAEVEPVVARLRAIPSVGTIHLMTHFADADGPTGIEAQLEHFLPLQAALGLPTSLANSATLLRFPEQAGDVVRPGIMLYGGSPMPDRQSAQALGLQPVMTLVSQIIAVQTVTAGQAVGYGATFVADRPMRVGVVACGYADGYPRHAPTGTPIRVAGVLTRTLGRVSMDMLACDLSEVPNAEVGAPVVLWGAGLPADDVATAAGTISYELFCALAPRVPVHLISASSSAA